VHLCPVDREQALAMLRTLRGAPLLEGARGGTPVDLAALASIVVRLSEWPIGRPEIAEVDLNPILATPAGAIIVDAKVGLQQPPLPEPHATEPGIAPFFAPRSVAVVGASQSPRKAGNVILRNLLRFGFEGRVLPVHPGAEPILGLPSFPSLSAIAGGAELAVVVVPKERLGAVIEDAAASATRHLIIATGGFGDAGPAGQAEQDALLARAGRAGIRVMGPNSIGVVSAHARMTTSITTLAMPKPGRVALVGQTGTFASGYANWFASRGRPAVGKIACIGNKGDVDEADVLDYLADDPQTEIIGLYTEGVRRRAFVDALGKLAGRKPVVALRAGRTEIGRAAIASHTGSLVGDAAIYDQIFRDAGVVPVDDMDELLLMLEAFDTLPWPHGNRLGVVSVTGVGCVLAADAAPLGPVLLPELGPESQLRVRQWIPQWAPARNPYDIWSAIEKQGPEAAFRGISAAVIDAPEVDALLLVLVVIEESRFDVGALVSELRARAPHKPILATIVGAGVSEHQEVTAALEQAGALCAATPARALRVLGRMASWTAFRAAHEPMRDRPGALPVAARA
jgi:acyl-CoA synthetase (NDP forming)